MSHWIQIRKTGIFFCSTVSNLLAVDLECPLDCEKCSEQDLLEWAREQAEKYGDCEIYDAHGSQILSDDDFDNVADSSYGYLYTERRG